MKIKSDEDRARIAVEKIISNIKKINGLGVEWSEMEENIQDEIKIEWSNIILNELNS